MIQHLRFIGFRLSRFICLEIVDVVAKEENEVAKAKNRKSFLVANERAGELSELIAKLNYLIQCGQFR